MARIHLDTVDKIYPGGVHAVRCLDLTIEDGELLVLLGPSGCGKSTVLRLVAGLEPLSGGRILLGDRRIDHERPDRRDVAMVFQSYALYGHMSVRGNIEFPLRMRGVGREERRGRAEEIAELLELGPLLDTRPGSLSGGQRQRVAMARALVRRPAAFLLDEPLSNLDVRLRTHVREEIRRIQRTLGVTTVHVTHDQVEALSLGDRVAILKDGELQQVGPGQELYDRPANTFVASFLGQPGMNLMAGRLVRGRARGRADGWTGECGPGGTGQEGDPDGWAVELPGVEGCVPVGETWSAELAAAGAPGTASLAADAHTSSIVLGIRPEDVRLTPPGAGALPARVLRVEDLGSQRVAHLDVPAPSFAPGSAFTAVLDRRQPLPSAGERVGVELPADTLHLFDSEGRALRGAG